MAGMAQIAARRTNDHTFLSLHALIGALGVLSLAVIPPAPALAASPTKVFAAHDPNSTAVIDHSDFGAFVSRYLSIHEDGVNRFAYGAVTAEDRAVLDAYLVRLAGMTVTDLPRAEQFAYWANFYNALTLAVVLDAYPVKSILNIRPGLFSIGPWKKKRVTVEGVELSLDDMEHEILRKIWRDPRVHYAVNCASIGCPNLYAEPFTGEGLDARLDDYARAYVNHARGASVDERGRLTVSRIYRWYKEDFGGDDAGVIAHLKKYAGEPLKARLEGIDDIARTAYDWSLNEPEAVSGTKGTEGAGGAGGP